MGHGSHLTLAYGAKKQRAAIVDGDMRRRAAISHCLAGNHIHVEPFDGAHELIAHWPKDHFLLVHSDDHVLSEIFEYASSSGNWLPTIAYAEQPDIKQVVRAMRHGAINFVTFPFTVEDVLEAVSDVELEASPLAETKMRETTAKRRVERLTRRERDVLCGVASGMSNRIIAEKLSISRRTVEVHRANLLKKIGATHTTDAIRIAIEASLVKAALNQ